MACCMQKSHLSYVSIGHLATIKHGHQLAHLLGQILGWEAVCHLERVPIARFWIVTENGQVRLGAVPPPYYFVLDVDHRHQVK